MAEILTEELFDKLRQDEVEQAFLAAVLIKPALMHEFGCLSCELFGTQVHGKIFGAMKHLFLAGKQITPVLIKDFLNTNEEWDYMVQLVQSCSGTLGVHEYAEKIKSTGYRRLGLDLIFKSLEGLQTDKDFDVPSFLIKELSDLTPPMDFERVDLNALILQQLENKIKNKGKIAGLQCGLAELDTALNGFQKGNLYIVAGRPSMGKTSLLASMVNQIEQTSRAGILSLEMTKEQMKQRIACIRAGIAYWKVDKGILKYPEFEGFANALRAIDNVVIDDKGAQSKSEIFIKMRNMVKKHNCDIIFIDHIGLINTTEKNVNQATAIGLLTSGLKALAKELNVPVVALSQLSRGIESKESKRPSCADLRDSGRIEEDADAVIFIYRPEYYLRKCKPEKAMDLPEWEAKYGEKKNVAELIIDKNRNGECKICNCFFDLERMRFYDGAV